MAESPVGRPAARPPGRRRAGGAPAGPPGPEPSWSARVPSPWAAASWAWSTGRASWHQEGGPAWPRTGRSGRRRAGWSGMTPPGRSCRGRARRDRPSALPKAAGGAAASARSGLRPKGCRTHPRLAGRSCAVAPLHLARSRRASNPRPRSSSAELARAVRGVFRAARAPNGARRRSRAAEGRRDAGLQGTRYPRWSW